MEKICPVCKNSYGGGEVFCPIDAARLIDASEATSLPRNDGGDPLVGQVLDKYRIVRRIGEGGMGLVYEAIHTVIEKRVAIKILRDDFSSRPEVVERFRQEAKSASRIGHLNIVDISDFGETPHGNSYFVMEFLEGEDLANVLVRETCLDVPCTVAILRQCCHALGAAHAKGIVHRDMKPENIFLTHHGDQAEFAKIVDFGIAKMSDIETDGEPGRKLTKTGMIFGTPAYMSPEQAAGKELDHRVDVYAMGVILFECLTGRVPFVGDSFMGILTQHMFEDPPSLRDVKPDINVSTEIEMVVTKALQKDPDARYQNMVELDEALEMALLGRATEATLYGYGEPVKEGKRGAPGMVAADTGEFQVDSSGPSKGMLVGLATLVVLVGAAVAFFAGGGHSVGSGSGSGGEVGRGPEVATPPATDATTDAGDAELADAGVDAAPPEAPSAPTSVAITVLTTTSSGRPMEGAEISVGDGEGCDSTPCVVTVPIDEPVVLNARKARYVGRLELPPPTSDQTVQVILRAARNPRTDNSGSATPSGMTMSPNTGLKQPSIFSM